MRFLFLPLLAFPLHAYDAKAVYADYLTAMAIYNTRDLGTEETGLGPSLHRPLHPLRPLREGGVYQK